MPLYEQVTCGLCVGVGRADLWMAMNVVRHGYGIASIHFGSTVEGLYCGRVNSTWAECQIMEAGPSNASGTAG